MNAQESIMVTVGGRRFEMPSSSGSGVGTDVAVPASTSQAATPPTLDMLVALLGEQPHAVGTAVNDVFVARDVRASHRLQHGDHVRLFRPIVGG